MVIICATFHERFENLSFSDEFKPEFGACGHFQAILKV